MIAILGLFLAGLPALTSMGISVAFTVVIAMAAAITLLPGLLGLAGTKIDKLSIHRKSHVTKPAHETFAGRWAHHVGSHPVRYAVVGLVALLTIAAPTLGMRIGTPDDGNAASRYDAAQGVRPARRRLRRRVQRSDPGRDGSPDAGRHGRRRSRSRRTAGRPRSRRRHRCRSSTLPATPRC